MNGNAVPNAGQMCNNLLGCRLAAENPLVRKDKTT